MRVDTIVKYMLLLIGMVVLIWALYRAQVFLIPLAFGAVFAMLMLPVAAKLEDWGFARVWSSLTATLLLVVAIAGLLFFLSAMARNFAEQLPKVREQIVNDYQTLRQTVQERWDVALPELSLLQNEAASSPAMGKGQLQAGQSSGSGVAGAVSSIIGPILQFVVAMSN